MKIACSCMVMVLLLAGCATTGDVDTMIDSKMAPQIEKINSQLDAQSVAASQTLEDMKDFIDRLGTTLNKDVSDLESGVADLETQIADVKKDLKDQPDLKGVEAKISKLDASVGTLNDSIDQVSIKTATVAESVSVLEKAEKERAEAAAAAAEAKAQLPAKGLFHKHAAGVVE